MDDKHLHLRYARYLHLRHAGSGTMPDPPAPGMVVPGMDPAEYIQEWTDYVYPSTAVNQMPDGGVVACPGYVDGVVLIHIARHHPEDYHTVEMYDLSDGDRRMFYESRFWPDDIGHSLNDAIWYMDDSNSTPDGRRLMLELAEKWKKRIEDVWNGDKVVW